MLKRSEMYWLRIVIAAIGGAAALAVAGGAQAQMSGRRATRQPETIALVFHAGWCPACKVLGPNLQQVRPDFDDKAILWVTLDQTDRASRQAEYLAAALGAESVWQDYRGKTGFVVLIDAKTKTVVGKITSDSTPEEIRETLAFVKG